MPQRPETWAVAVARLRLWITPEDQPPVRPYVVLVASEGGESMVGVELIDHDPAPDELLRVLLEAIARPEKHAGRPRRPARVACADPARAAALAEGLAQIGVACETREWPMLPAMVADLEQHMRDGEPEPPGLLSVAGVTPPLAGGFFAAAAWLYT